MTMTEPIVAGRYRIIRPLGAGGMGRVWLARDEVLRRDVAVKEIMLPFGLPEAEREELRQRTMREARAAARLSHPNVVQIYDVQSGDEQPWIVMEHVPSRSLLQVIEENGPLPVEQVAGIGLAVLSALDAANRVGVLHRDVKPSNVLIADDGRVVLTDFGSAMIDEGDGAITRTGVILGSPLYTAPERVDRGVSTAEADLWSLGATLYAAAEGRPPYTRATTLGSLIAITTDKPDHIRLAGPLKPVLLGLLHRNPAARMKPTEVEERLRRLADVQTTVHLRHVPRQRDPEPATAPAAVTAGPVPAGAAGAAAAAGAPGGAEATEATAATAAIEATAPLVVDVRPVDTDPAPRPLPTAPAGARRTRYRAMVAAAAAALAAAVIATLALTTDMPERWTARGAPLPNRVAPVASASPDPVRSAAPSVEPLAAAPLVKPPFVLPAGFLYWTDRTGYQVAWPASWTHQRESPTVMFFCAPGGPPTLRIRVWDGAGPDLAAALAREESAAKLPGYDRMRLAAVPGAGGVAEWEYMFKDPKAGELHGLERAFVAGGRTYLVQWRTQPDRWERSKADLTVVLDSFKPATAA
jgi:hypothetical protein